jgi:hypothetical protein
MTLKEALEIVKERYGLLPAEMADCGAITYVVAAERQLRAMPEVGAPELGIAILASEVIELARGATTIEALARRKNPDLFRPKM